MADNAITEEKLNHDDSTGKAENLLVECKIVPDKTHLNFEVKRFEKYSFSYRASQMNSLDFIFFFLYWN